jgi:hypothetical protein
MDDAKVTEAVEVFLHFVEGHERPFRQLVDYLAMLSHTGWAEDDIEALRERLMGELVKRRNGDAITWLRLAVTLSHKSSGSIIKFHVWRCPQ